jgi:hypothetical protein
MEEQISLCANRSINGRPAADRRARVRLGQHEASRDAGPRLGTDQAFNPEPFYQGLNESKVRLKVRKLTNHNGCSVIGMQHFIDPGISKCNALQTFVPP